MFLKDTRIKNAKPGTKPYKLADGEGLHLEVRPNGSKLWRLRYRLHGKENTFAIGKYPIVSLAHARESKDEARGLIANGINPALHRKQERVRQRHESNNTFQAIAKEWLSRNSDTWTEKTYLQRERLLIGDVFPIIGSFPIREVVPAQILEIIQRVERRAPTMAIIVQQAIGAVFRLAILTLRADNDPTQVMRGVLKQRTPEHHKTLDSSELPFFLRAVDEYQGYIANQLALKLALFTLARTNEILQAEWNEFDFENAIWKKPADKVKKREEHTVPLPDQAIALLGRLQAITGHRQYLFPNRTNPSKPASKGVLWKAFVSMGYQGKFSPHGIRGTASTILNEMGFRADVIEKQLDHSERDKSRASYNHADYLDERRDMMQTWVDYLDGIKEIGNIISINHATS